MKIVVTSKKIIRTMTHGVLPKGVPVDVPDSIAMLYISKGDAVRFETKEILDRPIKAAGQEQPLSALPAAQASPQMTSSSSETGVKRRGRKKQS